MENKKVVYFKMREEKIRIELLIHDLKVPLAVIETGIMSL